MGMETRLISTYLRRDGTPTTTPPHVTMTEIHPTESLFLLPTDSAVPSFSREVDTNVIPIPLPIRGNRRGSQRRIRRKRRRVDPRGSNEPRNQRRRLSCKCPTPRRRNRRRSLLPTPPEVSLPTLPRGRLATPPQNQRNLPKCYGIPTYPPLAVSKTPSTFPPWSHPSKPTKPAAITPGSSTSTTASPMPKPRPMSSTPITSPGFVAMTDDNPPTRKTCTPRRRRVVCIQVWTMRYAWRSLNTRMGKCIIPIISSVFVAMMGNRVWQRRICLPHWRIVVELNGWKRVVVLPTLLHRLHSFNPSTGSIIRTIFRNERYRWS
mmetsp:Transcript_11315/g.21998  ORF Transcript_11315/g.21998 Transcript_11315/m.21998 type:complete len:320 (+) Transcript_11315:642-1601(+)